MDDDKKQFTQRLRPESISHFNDCFKLVNEQLKVTGSEMSKGEMLEEMIDNYYYRILGKTNDAETVNKINTLIDDSVDAKFDGRVMKLLEQTAINTVRGNRLMELLIRISAGTYEEQIQKRMDRNQWSREQAEESLNDFIANSLFEPCPYVEAVDTEMFDDDNE